VIHLVQEPATAQSRTESKAARERRTVQYTRDPQVALRTRDPDGYGRPSCSHVTGSASAEEYYARRKQDCTYAASVVAFPMILKICLSMFPSDALSFVVKSL